MKRLHKGYVEERDSKGRLIHTVNRRCTRCGTKRKNAYRPVTYEWLWSDYKHPENYLTHGTGLDRRGIRQLVGGTYDTTRPVNEPIPISRGVRGKRAG